MPLKKNETVPSSKTSNQETCAFSDAQGAAQIQDPASLLKEKEDEIAKLRKLLADVQKEKETSLKDKPENGMVETSVQTSPFPLRQEATAIQTSTIPQAPPLPQTVQPQLDSTPPLLTLSQQQKENSKRVSNAIITPTNPNKVNKTSLNTPPIRMQDLIAGSHKLRSTTIKRSPGGTPLKSADEIEKKSTVHSSLLLSSLQTTLKRMRPAIAGDDELDSTADSDEEENDEREREINKQSPMRMMQTNDDRFEEDDERLFQKGNEGEEEGEIERKIEGEEERDSARMHSLNEREMMYAIGDDLNIDVAIQEANGAVDGTSKNQDGDEDEGLLEESGLLEENDCEN
ncbi:uncharacterized protein MONOS_4437 [Monocercomonoides exilis]|uniref:uncharacterized protein n=1 Tax=Monocercomonoides exilis TaxID=2049356 RepID=UPI00355A3C0A|nr:hypothetical protein MONOS_4437 [Monocercomonoides exilis]|eukprot:MONOS_4437.1-p1 / transcript=MONOS_4437.1 / gene=MONOS_4437 / organism=Monocercomonoides_exilis_PA203 / gene_product=unspecified product / transcript_product=unspecified product / location=Mono_scaffold00118:20093-21435(-) / protein_length=344 / sequence_SO=supercontig / SO=protein_coding / is_pseudo=false